MTTQKQLKESASKKAKEQKNIPLEQTRGCCAIHFNGGTTYNPGLTRQECEDEAANYPGATYSWNSGNCPDAES